MDERLGCPASEDAFGSEASMTMTTMVVLMTTLADHRNGPARTLAPDGRSAAAPAASVVQAGATCALRVVQVPPAFDSGILARPARHFGDAIAGDDAIVRDSLSPCAGVAGRRVSGGGTGER
jgi:hypothetical protein